VLSRLRGSQRAETFPSYDRAGKSLNDRYKKPQRDYCPLQSTPQALSRQEAQWLGTGEHIEQLVPGLREYEGEPFRFGDGIETLLRSTAKPGCVPRLWI
jgi:hypothetical protein